MKNAIVLVATVNELPAAEAMLALENCDSDKYVILLDGKDDKAKALPSFCFTVLLPSALKIKDFYNKAFFWQKEELRQYIAVCVVKHLLVEYASVVLLNLTTRVEEPLDSIFNQYSKPDAITILLSPEGETGFSLPLDIMPRQIVSQQAGMLFNRGNRVKEYLRWCISKLDFIYGQAYTSIKDTQHTAMQADEQAAFIFTWPLFTALFSIPQTQVTVKASSTPIVEGSEYEFSYFSDGVPILSLLRPYFIKEYRLRIACKGNPFAHRELFTDTSVVPGDTIEIPYTAVAACVWNNRPDIQAIFPDPVQEHRTAYMRWFINNAPGEYGMPEAYYSCVQLTMDTPEIPEQKPHSLFARLGFSNKNANPADRLLLPGVNFCAHIRGDYGIGEAARMVASAMDAAEVPFGIVDFASERVYNYSNEEWLSRITNDFRYKTNLMYTNAEGLSAFRASVSKNALNGRYNIGYWAWEMPEFPAEWMPAFEGLDEVWALSQFTADAIAAVSPVPVFNMPHPVVVRSVNDDMGRCYFSLPEETFLFLMMYDVRSVSERKNPQAAIEAFQKAFGDSENVALVIKVNAPESMRGGDALLASLEGCKNIEIINKTLSREEQDSLLNCCDAFVSLHRSEGFGFGPAEAMYLGKPVIATNWSGSTEYMRDDNCCPVSFKIVELEKSYGPYQKGWHWAEPDVAQATQYMIKLFSDAEYRKQISLKGQETIKSEFPPEKCGVKIKNRLQELGAL